MFNNPIHAREGLLNWRMMWPPESICTGQWLVLLITKPMHNKLMTHEELAHQHMCTPKVHPHSF